MTTSERQITTPSSELISACRKSYGKAIRQTAADGERDRRRPGQARRAGGRREPLLDQLAAAREARPAQEQGEDDDEEDEQLGQPPDRRAPLSVGNQLCVAQ